MFRDLEYHRNVSLSLSQVMNEIGVNERQVLIKRQMFLIREPLRNLACHLRARLDSGLTCCKYAYCLGSKIEGTTTEGLGSDEDYLTCLDEFNIIQELADWRPGVLSLLMIQDENTFPGYCLLQPLRKDAPLPFTHSPNDTCIKDSKGRLVFKNAEFTFNENSVRQGPAFTVLDTDGLRPINFNLQCPNDGTKPYIISSITSQDYVPALPCKSWPKEASSLLQRQSVGGWPTNKMKTYAEATTSFVVGVGSKVTDYNDVEWRISTSLAERSLMFNLNITQIRCYVLLKMIVKTFLNAQSEGVISSFMCKTVLLYCIEKTPAREWCEENLLACLTSCLFMLKECISSQNCPHFIIPANNLMAGRLSFPAQNLMLESLGCLINSKGRGLLKIKIDDLGDRLKEKFNIINKPLTRSRLSESASTSIALRVISALRISHKNIRYLSDIRTSVLKMPVKMPQILNSLTHYYRKGNSFEKTACKLIAPLLCTQLGSMMASIDIKQNKSVSSKAFDWFSKSLNSDVSSSRLKFATVYYCTGDMQKTECLLRETENDLKKRNVLSACSYRETAISISNKPLCTHSTLHQMHSILGKNLSLEMDYFALCVIFLPYEMNCVPDEMVYKMFKSTTEDPSHRNQSEQKGDRWMDWAVLDSLPYLYFLRYKTYGRLKRFKDQN